MNCQVAPTTAAGDWRQWFLPFLIALSLASIVLQAESCFEQGEPKIPAHSDRPMKD